ncbi:MAG TPA: hypothetical protein VME66_12235 [Candidatus Acidoferrales bacterium]|nr:hypothetical protein [Candidatus Acidoferrales bacterium]
MSAQALEARMSRVEGVLEQVDKRLDSIDGRLDGFYARFGRIDQRFNWVIGTILGLWITTILAILFHR